MANEKPVKKWFYFLDMASGGRRKTAFDVYFVEALDESNARELFTKETGQDPDDIACPCCGQNFSVSDPYDSLEECKNPSAFGTYESKII